MVTRHEFLARLHQVLQPKVYLEVGVQWGTSLALAAGADVAIGIDPYPLVPSTGNQQIYTMTSREFFRDRRNCLAAGLGGEAPIDLAFIDGSHLFEDAIEDFLHIASHCARSSVVAFDDVLPYEQRIAERVQPPGDWTGDVWKCTQILMKYRGDLQVFEVDTYPTGTLLVYGFGRMEGGTPWGEIIDEYMPLTQVPDATINRTYAVSPEDAIKELMQWRLESL